MQHPQQILERAWSSQMRMWKWSWMRSGPISWQVQHPLTYFFILSLACSLPIDCLFLRKIASYGSSSTSLLLGYGAFTLPH